MSDIFGGSADVLGGSGGGGSATVKTSATVAGLGSGIADGDLGLLRVGTHPNKHEVWLRWDANATKWVSEEITLVTQQDNWAMDLGNRNATQLVDWSAVDNPVPYGRAYALITGALNLSAANFNIGTGTGVITVDDTTSPHSFPFSTVGGSGAGNYLHVRDNVISYTGKTGTTFTGCTVVEGTRGTIPDQEYIAQAYVSGWGFVTTPLNYAAQLFAAGLKLQERLTALMNSGFFFGAVTEKKILLAPYWYQYDQGDGQLPPQREIPPTGGLGVSATLASLASTGGGAPGSERNFHVTLNGWTDWGLTAPIKESLIPMMVAKMESGGVYSGSVLDTKLTVRWTS